MTPTHRPARRTGPKAHTAGLVKLVVAVMLAALAMVAGFGTFRTAPAPAVATGPTSSGTPAPVSPGPSRVAAAWDDATHLRLVIWGSSTCPFLPTLTSAAGRHLVFTARADGAGAATCEQDDAPGTTIVALPAGITSEQGVTVEVNGRTVPVPALPVATIVMD